MLKTLGDARQSIQLVANFWPLAPQEVLTYAWTRFLLPLGVPAKTSCGGGLGLDEMSLYGYLWIRIVLWHSLQ